MFTQTLFLAAALLSTSFQSAPAVNTEAIVFAPIGGPPRINIAGKSSGDITKAEWAGIKAIDLHGCVPDARITALTLCIRDCSGKDAGASGSNGSITTAMRTMISNLPTGTSFTVKVTVKDAKGKLWEVSDAKYVWKG